MEYRQLSLRTLALKLNVSGTAEVLDETKLYQGSYGFIKLQIYAPKTQNTEAPLCTVFKTTVDELGREKVSGVNHNLVYVGEYTLNGEVYLLFENYLPKPFTDTVGDLKITVNYYDTAPTLDASGNTLYDTNGVPRRHATDLLISNQYATRVAKGGYNADGVELQINSAEAAQINGNTLRIISLEYDVAGLHNYIDTAVGEIHAEYELVVEEGGKLDVAIDKANTIVATASSYAATAQKANEEAEESRQAAETAKNEALGYAGDAANSANTATEKATAAAASAARAQELTDNLDDTVKAAAEQIVIDTTQAIVAAQATAQQAVDNAQAALTAAEQSAAAAAESEESAQNAAADLTEVKAELDNARVALQTALGYINELEELVVDKIGTSVKKDGAPVAQLNVSAKPTVDAGALYDAQGRLSSNAPTASNNVVRLEELANLLLGGSLAFAITTEAGDDLVTESGDALQINLSL